MRILRVVILVLSQAFAFYSLFAQQIIKAYSPPSNFNIRPMARDTFEVSSGDSVDPIYRNEKKTALIFGNGTYKKGPLHHAVNDALDMAAVLSAKGFKVIFKQNATREEMRNGLREFSSEISAGGVGLFYYAGHGLQIDGSNYLIPIDADIEMKAEVAEECINASAILRTMEYAHNRINIIILDACRNNPFRSFTRSEEKGITKMDPPKGASQGAIIAFATAPGEVASDGIERNGLYTSKLLKHINTPGLKLEEVFKKVRVEVAATSEGKQIPWENNSLTGEFYFTWK